MNITEADKVTELYFKLLEELNTRLASHRVRLEASQPQDQTEKLRGKIEETRRLISLLVGAKTDAA